ncbi:DUF2157 domain-containing protein [Hymenobacter aerilatus]|uniref:DUF2157 domain-containing protein n=1 Tax=Hymenobacter aerilatus TaxID=2932251 RepID=A0A8T9SRI1_9BACT|nr:DUF2157 domain-containing protein [Hymenobacter aerilatus]UOR04357.1 DUF2157 domain-containing protein [Hymenobacter aerilatus]
MFSSLIFSLPPVQPTDFVAELRAREVLTEAQAEAIYEYERTRPFSLHYELRTLLYLGIVLLTGGLGVLLYQHADDISHSLIVAALVLLMAGSFGYAARHQPPFTWQQAPTPSVLPDYLLLLGCLLFLSLEGYLQAKYTFFSNRYGLATLLPALLFLPLAYRFDHRGVLSMAITALAAWVGLSVAPLSVFSNQFLTAAICRAAIGLGMFLLLVAWQSEKRRLKPHFAYTYLLLGSNLLLASATAAMSQELLRPLVLLFLLILGVCAYLFLYARRTHSYLFMLLSVGYGYVAVTYGLFSLLEYTHGDIVGLFIFYIICSVAGIVWFLANIQKIVGTDDRQSL